jgi:hypothetical protein
MQNINPDIWGMHGWKFMHYITLAYPDKPTEEEKYSIKLYFNNVGKVLPCYSCRINYEKHLNKYPLDDTVVLCQTNLVKWLVDIHNAVNTTHGKRTYTMDEFYGEYLGRQNKYYENYILIIILVILVVIFLMKKFI